MNILFIEDDMIETMKLKRTVSKLQLKHKITEAKNGEEALDILKSGNTLPDIILLDLNMPRMSGIEFLSILKADDVIELALLVMLLNPLNMRTTRLKCKVFLTTGTTTN